MRWFIKLHVKRFVGYIYHVAFNVRSWKNAPINVKPLGGGGGRPGIGGGFDVTSLSVVGTLDHSLSSFDRKTDPSSNLPPSSLTLIGA